MFVGAFAAFVPGDIVGDMTSIGTLFAFMLVCAGVWIMRVKRQDIPRQFKTPLVPLVPLFGHARMWRHDLRIGLAKLVASGWMDGFGHDHLLWLQQKQEHP